MRLVGNRKILKVWGLQNNNQIGTKEMNQVVMCRMDGE